MWGTVAFTFPLGKHGPRVTLSRSVVWGSDRLSVDGKDIERSFGPDRAFLVPLNNGKTASLTVRARGYDYAPKVFVDGTEIPIAKGLALWEYSLAALPLLLLVPFAFVGVVVGFGAMATNQWVLRLAWPLPARVAATLGVDAAGSAVALGLVAVFRAYLGGG